MDNRDLPFATSLLTTCDLSIVPTLLAMSMTLSTGDALVFKFEPRRHLPFGRFPTCRCLPHGGLWSPSSVCPLLYSQGKLPRAGTLHRAKARYMLPPRPSCLRSSSPSPVTPSLSAGFCLCWLGLPPTLPGRGDRGQTHRANSHCRSTGRARAPPAEAAARLPHHPPPSPHPWAMGWGSLGATAGCSSQSRTGSVRSGAHTLFPY